MNNTVTTNTNVIPLDRNAYTIRMGLESWAGIKKLSVTLRAMWKDVGEALLVGRKLHPSNQAFSKWCEEVGFGDMDRRVRADAMWFASTIVVQPLDNDLIHPTSIRTWYNEHSSTSQLPSELQEIQPTNTVTLDTREAEKVAKVVNRAASNDEGSEIAQRHVEALAKKHKVTVEELKQAAATGAPSVFYTFTPDQIGGLHPF